MIREILEDFYIKSTIGKILRVLFSVVLQPLDALWGIIKIPRRYAFDPDVSGEDTKEAHNKKRGLYFMRSSLSFGNVAAFIASLVCILGFLGALAVPFPGVAPVYAALITLGCSAFMRMAGAAIGSHKDTKPIYAEKKEKYPAKRIWLMIKMSLTIGFVGEAITEFSDLVTKPIRRIFADRNKKESSVDSTVSSGRESIRGGTYSSSGTKQFLVGATENSFASIVDVEETQQQHVTPVGSPSTPCEGHALTDLDKVGSDALNQPPVVGSPKQSHVSSDASADSDEEQDKQSSTPDSSECHYENALKDADRFNIVINRSRGGSTSFSV